MKRSGWLTLALVISLLPCPTLPCRGGEKVKTITGSYKQALHKAGEAGKPLMIDFYTDWCGWCKKLDTQFEMIPNSMAKFAYYRVNAEQDRALAKQFQVQGYPTIVFVKPDGTEFHRWAGYKAAEELKQTLESVAEKAGKIEKTGSDDAGKSGSAPGAKSANETTAANELKTALMYLNVGRKTDAKRGFKQIITKYPDTEAAVQAQTKLDEMESK